MHTKKFDKGGMTRILAHVTRSRDTVTESKIDETRTHLNVDLLPTMQPEQLDHYKSLAKRKDAVLLVDTIVTLPQELKYSSRPKQLAFFRDASEALGKHIGGVPVFATVHYDETTPHMHYGVIPLTKDGRLSAKEIVTRQMLKTLHPKVTEYVQSKGWEVTLYEENEEVRQIEHDLGMSRAEMHDFKKKEYHNQLLQEGAETIDKNLAIAQKDLQRSERPVKRRKGETRAEYKERRKEYVEVKRDEYERLKGFEMQMSTVPNKLRAEKSEKEAAKHEAEMAAEHREIVEASRAHAQHMRRERENFDREIERRAELKAEQRVREALGRNSDDYTKRLEKHCKELKFQDGTSVFDAFEAKEQALRKSLNRGISR